MNIKELLKDLRDTAASLKDFIIQVADRKILRAAILHFIVTLFSDELVFEYGGVSLFYIIRIKIIFLIILIIIWHLIGYLVKNYSKSEDIRNFIKFSGIYFAVMMLFQFALWPFIIGDQMYYCYFADSVYLTVNPEVFQSIFIKYFRIYSLMLVPNLAGIVIVQLCVISLIIGCVMSRIKKHFGLAKWVYLFYIPFLTPVVIQHNLLIEKDILNGYFTLLLFSILVFKKFSALSDKININLLITAAVSSIVIAIRPGSIIFFAVTPVLIYLLNYKEINLRKIILFLIFSVFSSFIFVPNYMSTVVFNRNGDAYKNVYILNNAFKLLLYKAVYENNKEILDKFQNSEDLKLGSLLHKDINDVNFFIKLSEADKKKFTTISKTLVKEYFYDYISYKFKIFYNNLRFIRLSENIGGFYLHDNIIRENYNSIKNKIRLVNSAFYTKMIKLFKKYDAYITVRNNNFLSKLFIAIYFVLFAASLIFGIKKIFIITCFLISYLVLQILIVPYPGFRFYFPCYITGYLFIFYLIFYFIRRGHINEY